MWIQTSGVVPFSPWSRQRGSLRPYFLFRAALTDACLDHTSEIEPSEMLGPVLTVVCAHIFMLYFDGVEIPLKQAWDPIFLCLMSDFFKLHFLLDWLCCYLGDLAFCLHP